jgi:hypothetical protein
LNDKDDYSETRCVGKWVSTRDDSLSEAELIEVCSSRRRKKTMWQSNKLERALTMDEKLCKVTIE